MTNTASEGPKYTFEDFVEKANWNEGSQAGVLMEFVREHNLEEQLNYWLTKTYGWELDGDETDPDMDLEIDMEMDEE